MSSQAREISVSKKCANLCTLDAAVTLVSILLWLQLSSVVMLNCHLILIKIKIISRTFEKRPFRPIPIKCCLVFIKSTPDIVYGVARENNAVDLLPHQKQGKTILVIASTLQKCTATFLLTSLPTFSKSTQRVH